MNALVPVIITGIGATLVMDLGSVIRRWLFDTPFPNYALVGRWIAHSARGRFRHRSIAAATPVRGERSIGWLVHYGTGLAFAFLLSAAWGTQWFERPTLGPALITGLVTVLAPFLIMQPAMGSGFAASRAPRPGAARLQSLLNHTTFGLGLYLAALLINL
jgi:Protein of unknown function (DUF2938)